MFFFSGGYCSVNGFALMLCTERVVSGPWSDGLHGTRLSPEATVNAMSKVI